MSTKALPKEVIQTPDVAALMAEIRERVRADIEKNADVVTSPFEVLLQGTGSAGAGLIHRDELRAANLAHNYPKAAVRPDAITSHRGILGKPLVWAKRKLQSLLRESVLREYFEREQDYTANMVRQLNEVSRAADMSYGELGQKLEASLARLQDNQNAGLYAQERRLRSEFESSLSAVNAQLAEQRQQLATLDSVARGLESIVARLTHRPAAAPASSSDPSSAPDQSYLLLENRFRGSEDQIKARLESYRPLLASCTGTIVELGSGRGELLELLRADGVECRGVDLDPAMVEHCKQKGLPVELGNAQAFLEGFDDKSLGAIIATQVVEHLSLPALEKLAATASAKLKPGAAVFFETINTASMVALTQHFFRDPTHQFPLHPDTLRFILERSGLRVRDVLMLAPFAKEVTLQTINARAGMTPQLGESMTILNQNMERLNELLFGYQDYCIVAEPAA